VAGERQEIEGDQQSGQVLLAVAEAVFDVIAAGLVIATGMLFGAQQPTARTACVGCTASANITASS
jgi:hypothetical protein